jgi:hypothetical protein
MAAPNLLNPTTATGKIFGLALTTSAQSIITNAAASGTVVRVNALTVANVNGTANADVTVNIVRSVTNSGTYRAAFTVTVPFDASLVVIGKDNFIYLEEGDSLQVLASAGSYLEAVASYDVIA